MNWKLKARIQRFCGALPFGSEATYYALQRNLGSLRTPPDPMILFEAATRLVQVLEEHGRPVAGASVFEVGTGRKLDVPLAMYLCGAREVYTIDLHPYLKSELVMGAVASLRPRREQVIELFEGLTDRPGLEQRLDALLEAQDFETLKRTAGIHYVAPGDAAATDLPDGSIDIHLSYTVFEHIPGPVLAAILRESSRLLSPDGLALHHIDPSDHFAHEDSSITMINFLQFTDAEWEKLAGNQFAYHNRLRVDDFYKIYENVDHQVVYSREFLNEPSLEEIRGGFPLAEQYRGIAPERLATTVVAVLSRPRGATEPER